MKTKRRARHESRPGHLKTLARLSAKQAGASTGHPSSTANSLPAQPPRSTQSVPSQPAQPPPGAGSQEPQNQPTASAPGPRVKCQLCKRHIPLPQWDGHLHDPQHSWNARLAGHRQALEEGSQNRFGINIVQAELDFGILDLSTLDSWPTRDNVFYVSLKEGEAILKTVRLTSSLGNLATFREPSFSVRFSAAVDLSPGVMHAVRVTFNPRGNRGHYDDRVEFSFEIPSTGVKFAITRAVKATVTVAAHRQQLAPIAPYQRPRRRPRGVKGAIVEGERPPHIERHRTAWKYPLPKFPIPADLRRLLEEGTVDSRVQDIQNEYFPLGSSHAAYMEYWQALLWAEEHQAEKDMENYDQTGVQFAGRVGRLYLRELAVPGLAERRPSVVIGDSVLVRPTNSPSRDWFQGFVHGIQQTHVMLGFKPSFSSPPGQKIDVEFELNRLLFQRMHLAIRSIYKERRALFPEDADIRALGLAAPSARARRAVTPFDPRVAANPPQLQAVTAIARLPAGGIPFVIFGPPGTGKTVTVVEAIRQVLSRNATATILACAPSNNAADIVADRLRVALNPTELLRLNAPSRYKDLPQALQAYSLRHDDGSFKVPSKTAMKKYRVIVATCASGSLPHGIGIKAGHFTHIFIDEAGQASEPEVMIPIKLNAGPKTTIVLAGDPKQLGPVIRSPVARRLGLEASFLDRTMSQNMYKAAENRGVTYVKLIRNWRSHPAIIEFPNQEFYDGELEPRADPNVSGLCLGWRTLPNPKYPVVFHAIKGQDMRESSSPSWFNIEEASAVRDYVRDLRHNPQIDFTDEQIGIITPYRAQVRKMRAVLQPDFAGVKVGTTEEFQGDERHAIIVSTVRSSFDFVEFDLRHTLGFVANPRRFNVAMTRAKCVLIIVGDPDVLGLDPLWRRFLNYIHGNGGWRGIPIPWDPTDDVPSGDAGGGNVPYDEQMRERSEQDLQQLVARMSAIGLDALDEVEGAEADADLHWHEDE
ncbi:hypothetical protein FRC04_010330 [Tulasnella sp. 424]|nr:hypothetical protein FRC04_010330 [Tulasnella sp. 424]